MLLLVSFLSLSAQTPAPVADCITCQSETTVSSDTLWFDGLAADRRSVKEFLDGPDRDPGSSVGTPRFGARPDVPLDDGAWVPPVGSSYQKLSFNFFSSRGFFGDRPSFQDFSDANVTYYGEFGLAPRLAFIGTVPFQALSQSEGGVDTESVNVGDVTVGLRYQWFAKPFVISTSFFFKAPYFYDEDGELPPGNGQEDFEPRLLIGRSLGKAGYFGLEAGYRFRLQEPSDEFRYLVEYGIGIGPNFYARTKLDAIESINNGQEIPGGVNNPALNPEFDLGKSEFTVGWTFGPPSPQGRIGVEVTYTRNLYGDNTLQGDAVQVGLTLVR